jgi:hypothetical protein
MIITAFLVLGFQREYIPEKGLDFATLITGGNTTSANDLN